MENSCKWHRTTFVVVCIVSAALAIVCYVFYNSQPTVNNLQEDSHHITHSPTNDTPFQNITTPPIVKKIKIRKPRFPHCEKKNQQRILVIILEDYIWKKTTCDDNECQVQNLNNEDQEKTKERGMIVVYAAVVLLLVSLIAAFLEVYKARKTATVVGPKRDKPELSRRCSLADLTALRHNRRESMLRRNSTMHMSVDSAPNHRVPLKLLGKSLSSDSRGSSITPFPVKKKWQRSMSADEPGPTETHHRIHMIRHH